MDTSSIPIDSVHHVYALFPIKIDNLEYIPSEILYRIFMNVDDLTLLSWADASYRFECIAKAVVKDRNVGKYFVLDQKSRKQRKKYVEFFDHFGCHAGMNAIAAKNIKIRDENHWLPQMIHRHTNRIKKLTLDTCSGEQYILKHHTYFTHLAIRKTYKSIEELQIQSYHNLVKLELICQYDTNVLKSILRENPALESLILSDPYENVNGIMMIIAEHFKHLKELSIKDYDFDEDWPISNEHKTMIVDSLKHLESFVFSF